MLAVVMVMAGATTTSGPRRGASSRRQLVACFDSLVTKKTRNARRTRVDTLHAVTYTLTAPVPD